MKEFTLMTFESRREELLKRLQLFEDVHFRDLQQEEGIEGLEELERVNTGARASACENDLAKVAFVMDKIAPYVEKPSTIKALTSKKPVMQFDAFDAFSASFDHEALYDSVKSLDESIKTCRNEQNKLKAENELLKSWSALDASNADFAAIKSATVYVGTIGKMPREAFLDAINAQFDDVYVEFLGALKDETAAMVIGPKDKDDELAALMKNVGFSRSNVRLERLPSEQIRANEARMAELTALQEDASKKIASYADKQAGLEICHDYYQTTLTREQAAQNFLQTGPVVVLDGWVPEETAGKLTAILDEVCGGEYYLETTDVETDSEIVPVKLKNNPVARAFESITSMYSTPRYNEIDPTPLLAPFYLLFFAIMIGDMGYGLIVTIVTLIAYFKFNLSPGMKKFMLFFCFLGITTVLVGLLFGGAFGVTIFKPIRLPDGSYKAILDTEKDIITMLILSIVLGFIQLIAGLVIKAYMCFRDGKPGEAIFDSIFFMLVLFTSVGMLLGGMGIAPAIVGTISRWMFFGTLVGLGLTQGRMYPTLIGKIGGGFWGVYGLTSYVGDLVSYTRLVALSLSGAYIAFSFNLMAGLVPQGIPRVIFGTLICLFGQLLNIGLGLLGAYVHSCRLQYVEYFSKFYEGGGIPFKPLSLHTKYVDVK